jgi:transcriptional antiterminator NusG
MEEAKYSESTDAQESDAPEQPAGPESPAETDAPQDPAPDEAQGSQGPAPEDVGDEQAPARPDMQWCVLRVASNKEDQVREALDRKIKIEGLESKVGRILVPTERRPSPRGRGQKKFVDRKMYPGYVFLEMSLEEDGSIDEHAWFTIKETTGVGDFIGSAGKPTPMAKADVDKMLMQVEKAQEGAPVSVEFAPGDLVKIKEGAFENFEGEVEAVLPDKGLVRVVVTIFGRATPVELEFWQVEKT